MSADSVLSDSLIIVELEQELMFLCEPLLAQMPFPPYDLTCLDVMANGKFIYMVEKDTAQFKADVLDCLELKFLQPTDWDSTDVLWDLRPCWPGSNGYYKEISRRENGYMCP